MKTLDSIQLPVRIRSAVQEASGRLKSELPVSKVILFGSQARGQAAPDPDIDLLVLTTCPVTSDIKDKIEDILFDIDLKDDVVLTSVKVQENEWNNGLVSQMLIHQEVERDGCLV
ncbi:MAG: nucleotidyltransferase domain-containing protein [Phycisphaerae bacterium]|nr:nucleotidyltransferase domain-containing protein [Phycisphaerae bacterium]